MTEGPARSLGPGGPAVSAIAYGAMGLSGTYGPVDTTTAERALHHAIELGMTFVDTSDTYGADGHNERLVGRVIAARRDDVVLATKFGGGGSDPSATGRASPRLVPAWLDASLLRLGVDHVDLYYLHRVDPATPIEDTIGAMAELVEQGKVSHIGVSEAAPDTIRRAHAVHPLAAVQSEYSLFTRHVEQDVLTVCRELGIGFVAYSPLSRGLLAGAVSPDGPPAGDGRAGLPRFQAGALDANLDLAAAVTEAARVAGCTSAQLCLAWLLHQDEHIVPLVGSANPGHLDDNWATLRLDIDVAVLDALGAAVDHSAVVGERYSPDRLARVHL